jgi:hypothetical protein
VLISAATAKTTTTATTPIKSVELSAKKFPLVVSKSVLNSGSSKLMAVALAMAKTETKNTKVDFIIISFFLKVVLIF